MLDLVPMRAPRPLRPASARVALAAALVAAPGLAGCSLLEPPGERENPPDLTLRDLQLHQYRGGRLVAKAHVRELRYQRDTSRITGETLRYLPQTDGAARGTLLAGRVDGELSRGELRLFDGLTWSTPAGDRFETASCRLDLRANTAVGPDPVTMTGAGYALTAPRFRHAWSGPEQITLEGGVQARFDGSPAPRPAPRPARRRR